MKRPLYAVLFTSDADLDADYSPAVSLEEAPAHDVSAPHGLDRDVFPALAGLWYCLHLPGALWDLVDLPAVVLHERRHLHAEHALLLAPLSAFDDEHVGPWPDRLVPTLVIAPDDAIDEAAVRAEALGFALPAAATSTLSDTSLRQHWQAIHKALLPDEAYLGREPVLSDRLDLAPCALPTRLLSRQLDAPTDPAEASVGDLVDRALRQLSVLAAVVRLERSNTSPEAADALMPQVVVDEAARLSVPVTIGLPGVAPAYARNVYGRDATGVSRLLEATDERDTWSTDLADRDDHEVERAAIELLTAHSSVGHGGIGLMMPSVPAEAFSLVAQLERHFESKASGRKVFATLDRIDRVFEPLWTQPVLDALGCASSLTAFTNFPIGLVRPPGITDPLAYRIPVAYRPLTPLTRAVQLELDAYPGADLTAGFRVLVAECIPTTDPVGVIARQGWDVISDMFAEVGKTMTLAVEETLTPGAFRAAVATHNPDILVISAHGTMNDTRTGAAIAIGSDWCLGPELGTLPPVVILSACHVAPRGGGQVSIADLLLRQGAVAVLGTQVPVDVRRNAMLVSRFFTYLALVVDGQEHHGSLLEVWHRVQASNAVNDVLGATAATSSFATSHTVNHRPVIQEFMDTRSVDRLRRGHMYLDTVDVLGEMAAEVGRGEWFQSIMSSQGFIPESAFYVLIGRPDQILLRPPDFAV